MARPRLRLVYSKPDSPTCSAKCVRPRYASLPSPNVTTRVAQKLKTLHQRRPDAILVIELLVDDYLEDVNRRRL